MYPTIIEFIDRNPNKFDNTYRAFQEAGSFRIIVVRACDDNSGKQVNDM